MKIGKLLIVLFFILGIVGCSSTDNKDILSYEDHQYPKALGENSITKEEVSSLKKDIAFRNINTYGDLLAYLLVNNPENKDEIIETSLDLLYGNFDDLGIIKTEKDTLIYIKTNDRYYPIDVVNYNDSKWLNNYENCADEYETVNSMEEYFKGKVTSICKEGYKLNDEPYLVINDERITVFEKYGEPVYTYKEFEFPVALGYPELTDEELANITFSSAPARIKNYADAVIFLYNNLYGSVKPNPPTDVPEKNAITEYGFLTKYAEIIMGDYSEVGSIEMTAGDATGGACTFMLYIKADNGKYYWLDWYSQVLRDNKGWLDNYVGYEYKGTSYCFESVSDLKNALKDDIMNPCYELFKPYMNSISMWSTRVQSDENYKAPEDLETHIITLPDGSTKETFYRLGTECYEYCGTQIPLGTGLPTMTDEEIDGLLETDDLEYIKDKIKTVADLCGYFFRGEFIFIPDKYAKDIGFEKTRDDGWVYAASANQFNKLRFGVCKTSTNFANYVLKDDYEEFAMIQLIYEDDGHVEFYLKNDGIYYLFNPSSQFLLDYALKCPDLWLKEYTAVDTGSSDSLDELMSALIASRNPGTPDKKVVHCFAIDTYGNFCSGGDGVYPEDFKVKAWTESKTRVGTPGHDYRSNMLEFDYNLSLLPDDIVNNTKYQ